MRVSIYDIARELNVSPSTVSRALSNSELISDAVKRKVHEKADEMGYKGKNFRAGRGKNLVVIIPEINNYFYEQIICSMQQKLGDEYLVSIVCSFNSVVKEKSIISKLTVENTSCLVVAQAMDSTGSSHIQKAEKRGIPIVMFNRVDYEYNCPKFVIDNYMDSYQLVKHLVSSNYSRIAFAAKHYSCPVYRERVQAYQDVLAEAKYRFRPEYLIYSELTVDDVQEVVERFLALRPRPDALIMPGFSAALQALALTKTYNIDVPGDIAIVSFDEEPGCKNASPALTGVERPLNEIGLKIASVVDEICNNQPYERNTIQVFKSNLIIRNSSLRVRG